MQSKILAVLIIVLLLAGGVYAQEPPHWEYEGEEGPENWGELSPEFEACNGSAQSPIDISDATALELQDIEVSYDESAMNIFNNGHTIQVNYDEGSSITYNEITYDLLQFHFHTPSEHSIDGERAAMEAHFVHRNRDGGLAVIGVMLVEGDASEAYAPVFESFPAEKGEPEAMGSIDAASLLPQSGTFYTYGGSLTTPPCSEVVRWLVMTEPVDISAEQVEMFASIFEMNARPIQPLNDRDLLVDES